MSIRIILASASPRRRELLQQLYPNFDVAPADIDESRVSTETPFEYVKRMALEKAQAGYNKVNSSDILVIGSDTTVALGNQIYGKPEDQADAKRMLQELSGQQHDVLTSVAIHSTNASQVSVCHSKVAFKPLTDDEIEWYWHTGEPCDKAGGYAIQGKAAMFIEQLEGSYSGVMGLPLYETANLLKAHGIELIKCDKKY